MTMTLEELRADLATWQPRRTHDLSTIDAAIRERDELRTAVLFGKLCADAGADYKVRAEKAEAELAALKKRIAAARMETVNRPKSYWGEEASFGIVTALVDAKLIGSPVRLLVEDDDEH